EGFSAEGMDMGSKKLGRSTCAIRGARICAAVAAALVSCGSAMGTTYTWSGQSALPPFIGPVPFWSNANNWFAPGIPVSANTTDIVFGATPFPFSLQDLGNPFVVNSLSFTSVAPGYVLQGNPISLQGSATITQNSANAATVQNNLAFPAGGAYTGSGSMTISGALSGSGLVVDSTGILTLAGGGSMGLLNVNSGGTDVTAGVLNLTTPNGLLLSLLVG